MRPVMTPASTVHLKMEYAIAILVIRAVVVKVSAPDMENASTTNAFAFRCKVVLIWGNTASCQGAQGSVQVRITASATRKLRSVYVLRGGLGMTVVHLTVQENQFVPTMEAAVTPTQEGMIQFGGTDNK